MCSEIERRKDQINTERLYCQKFHHQCMTWYFALITFFTASITYGAVEFDVIHVIFISAVLLITWGLFSWILLDFAERIGKLNEYLESEKPPEEWRRLHKIRSPNSYKWFPGKGMIFFLFTGFLWLGVGIGAVWFKYDSKKNTEAAVKGIAATTIEKCECPADTIVIGQPEWNTLLEACIDREIPDYPFCIQEDK